jgi:hypothetical protein
MKFFFHLNMPGGGSKYLGALNNIGIDNGRLQGNVFLLLFREQSGTLDMITAVLRQLDLVASS